MADARIVSVTQANELVRFVLERDPLLSNLWIVGEVTQAFRSSSHHLYFTLSDGASKMKCVAFRPAAMRMYHVVEVGAQLTVNGRAGIYIPGGEYQLNVAFADASGQGIGALEFARLRAQLESEGLFDELRKRPMPAFPLTIGVVTSIGGAVIHDIQTVLRRRFPMVHLIVSPAQVQGTGAVNSIRTALDLLIADGRSELIIIARGGGSAEDLAPFNDEGLARQVFASPIPVVSAIGHETDFSLLDDVADMRAPTPTAAAELTTPNVSDIALNLIESVEHLDLMLEARFERARRDIDTFDQRLDRANPVSALARQRQNCGDMRLRLDLGVSRAVRDQRSLLMIQRAELRGIGGRSFDRMRQSLAARRLILGSLFAGTVADAHSRVGTADQALTNGWARALGSRRAEIDQLRSRLHDLDPTAVLERGFAVLESSDGDLLRSAGDVAAGTRIRAILRDGTIDATVDRVSVQPRIP